VDIAVDHGMGGEYAVRLLDQAAQFRGYPLGTRTDQGPEFTGRAFMAWGRRYAAFNIHPTTRAARPPERLHRELDLDFSRVERDPICRQRAADLDLRPSFRSAALPPENVTLPA